MSRVFKELGKAKDWQEFCNLGLDKELHIILLCDYICPKDNINFEFCPSVRL